MTRSRDTNIEREEDRQLEPVLWLTNMRERGSEDTRRTDDDFLAANGLWRNTITTTSPLSRSSRR